jgi:hypothetical protein
MQTPEWLDKYNAVWLSVPAYHDLTPTTKLHEMVTPWKGKEMKEISRYSLGVVTQSLQRGRHAQHHIFNLTIGFPWA